MAKTVAYTSAAAFYLLITICVAVSSLVKLFDIILNTVRYIRIAKVAGDNVKHVNKQRRVIINDIYRTLIRVVLLFVLLLPINIQLDLVLLAGQLFITGAAGIIISSH